MERGISDAAVSDDELFRVERRCAGNELFEVCARTTPQAKAVAQFTREVWTYQSLNCRANRLARLLAGRGAGPETRVGVCLERTQELVAMLLAVLKTGAAYVPLDPHHPTDRLEYIIGDAAARIVIAEESSLLPKAATRDVLLRADLEREAEGESTEDIERDVHAESASYLIYTSGSTGRPKGVVVTHRALSSLLSAMTSLLDVTSADRWLALTTLSFDIATLEWLLPLTVGAQVIMAGREEASEGRALREIAVRHGATIIQATPSMWRTILASGDLPQTLRLALCGGEAMSAALANRLRKRPVRKVWNLYGPTETTIWSTAHELADAEYRNSPPIGQPLSNTRVYVLNDDLEPAPENGEGELYIGGHGLAQGYMGSPDLTAERFVPDPFASARGARLYRTGDLVRLTSARELEFIGRKDDQVKVRGHRIELGEVEAEICRSVGIAEAAVICRPDDSGDSSLVAYFVAERNVPVWTSELRSLLQSRLPEYMIPSGFVEVRELPLTPNGKTDRRALAALAQRPSDEQRAPYVAPRTGTEETLARIWADVLKIQRVGGEDDFFDIGGHSLLAVEIILRIEEATQKRLTLLQLFENSTLSAFAGVIDRLVPTGQGSKAYELEP